MRILLIISSLSSGGAERVLTNLANTLSQKHDVIILTFSKDAPFYVLSENITHIKLDLLKESKNILSSVKNNIKRIFILKKIMKDINPDVNISFMTNTNILSIIATKLNHQKIIISERIVYDYYQSTLLNIIRKLIYPSANYLVTQTLADKNNYHFMNQVRIIYNPLIVEPLYSEREKIILAVGRLDKQKGFNNLIDAFSKTDSCGWKLFIAGDGPERENLQNQILQSTLTNIELLGSKKDIFAWYAKSSVFVLSSKKEGFPNALLEAMAHGCAVVSFDCPNGPNEIIQDGVNGILVENQNIKEFSEAMQKLMDDDALREKLSKESKKIINKYGIKKIANEWEELIGKVITND